MKIPEEVINEVVRPYICKVLRSASLEYPIIRGSFFIGPTYYYVYPLEHATDIEIQLCLNQLIYASIAEAIRSKLVPELEGLDFDSLRNEGMLIIESRKRFRRPIRTDKEIQGEIEITRMRDAGRLILAQANFQFENRSCFGSLELALIKPNESLK